MFSGIVEGKGKVLKIKDHGDYLNIEISPPSKFNKGLKKVLVFLLTESVLPQKIMALKH